MKQITGSCEQKFNSEPDLYAWPQNLEIYQDSGCHRLIDSTKEDICENPNSNQMLLIQEPLDFENSKLACEAMNGKMVLPKNQNHLDLLGNLIKSSKICEQAFIGKFKISPLDSDSIKASIIFHNTLRGF